MHDVLKPAGTFPDLKHLSGQKRHQRRAGVHLRRGDAAAAFVRADHVFEHRFRTQQVMHMPLEPMVSLAEPARADAHDPHRLAEPVVRADRNRTAARLAREQGARQSAAISAAASAPSSTSSSRRWLRRWRSWRAGRCKLALTMEEQFYTITKHATTFLIKSGVMRDGKIIARSCEVYWNGNKYLALERQ